MRRSIGRIRLSDSFALFAPGAVGLLRRSLPLLAVGLVLAFGLLPGGSRAATPSSDFVSESHSAMWDGPPFMTPTASPSCDGPSDPNCDNFSLTIVPPLSGSYQVTITITPFAAGDWDLVVFNPNGTVAGSSGNAPSQAEIVTLSNPAAGIYTVSAAPFAPAAGLASYTGTAVLINLGTPPPPPPPGNEPVTYGIHVPLPPLGQPGSDEPSIGCNWNSDKVMFAGALDTYRVSFDDCSSPATDTWEDKSFIYTSIVTLDPILFTDRDTGRTIVSQLSAKCSSMAFTDNDGDTWTPSQGCGINSGVDHQTVGGGRFADPLTRDPNGTLYPNAVYYCSQDVALAQCARSDTGGLTFGPAVPIYTLTECGGLHGQVKVSPKDGTVYVPNRGCNGEQAVVASEDNGITWDVRHIPGALPGSLDPSVGVANDGTVYFGWNNAGVEPKVAVSTDKGLTWFNIRDVGASLGIQSSIFPAVVAGDGDRAAMAFHGSTTPGGGGDDPAWPGDFFLFVAHTYDQGNTWTTVNATPNDPVQRATICPFGIGCENGTRNLLDFMGATIDDSGRVLVGFADGCIGNCVQSRPNSFTARSTIARQVNGRRLLRQFDQLAVPSAPELTATFTDCQNPPPSMVHLSWSAPDDHGSPITSYNIYRRTSSTSFALLTSVAGNVNSFDDTIDPNQTYFYQVTAVNGVGEGLPCGEVSPTCVGGPVEDPCVVPGVTVLSDLTGDATGGQSAHDIVKLSIAEPKSLGPGKIMFILKMASLASPTPDTTWPILLRAPNGTDFAARMHTNAAGQVFFTVATGANNTNSVLNPGTPADRESNFSADGTIQIVVSRSAIGNPLPGQQLTQFLVRIRVEAGAAFTPDNMPDSLARTGIYDVFGSENCGVCKAPIANNDAATTAENNPVVIDVVANDSDGGAPPLTVVALTQPANGTATDNDDGTVTYSPDTNFNGTDSFTYTARNACGKTDTATVQVTVNARPPEACFEDNDPQIEFDNGWHLVNDPDASAGHFRLNTGKDNPPHATRFTFNVPAGQVGNLTYHFAKSPKGGTADVYIDDAMAETISYKGSTGKTRNPEFGCADCKRTYRGLGPGQHKFELRQIRDAVYVDKFCLENSSLTSNPTSGPGPTTSSVNVLAAAQELVSSLRVTKGTLEISVMAEPGINAPIRIVLIDPTGSILQTAETTSGFAVIEKSVTRSGLYLIKVVNLGLGPVEVWTVATPLVAR